MSEVPLAIKYSAQTYDNALSNVVERWKQQGDGSPVKYDEAAIGMDESTVSVALKFLGQIGILEVPKAGSYIVPDEVVDYKTKMGDVRREAKQEVAARLDEYPLYKETKFMLGLNEFTVDALAEEVSGSAAVAAEKDELGDVRRSLEILAELEFLEIDEEGVVSLPEDLEGESGADRPADEPESEPEATSDAVGDDGAGPAEAGRGGHPPLDEAPPAPAGAATLSVEMDIAMDVTDMDADQITKKLEAINGALGQE